MNNWIWIGKFLIVIAAALVLGEVLYGLTLFQSTTLGTPKISAGSAVRFFTHSGALVLVWMLGERLARQIGSLRDGIARLADPVLALVTLIVVTSAYMVLVDFSAPLLGDGIRAALDWTFILGILASAGWLVWALFQNAEAVMEGIGKAAARRAKPDSK